MAHAAADDVVVRDEIMKIPLRNKKVRMTPEVFEAEVEGLLSDVKSMLGTDLAKAPKAV